MNEQAKINEFTQLFSTMMETKVADVMSEMGYKPGEVPNRKTSPEIALFNKRDNAVNQIARVWTNDGIDPKTGVNFNFEDMLRVVKTQERKLVSEYQKTVGEDAAASPDIMLIMPKVVSKIIREPIHYTENLTPLLRKVRVKGGQINISYPAVGAMGGQPLDMAEGQEYPEGTLDMAGLSNVKIGKSGIAVRWTQEMQRYSQFDFMAMLLREAARALARWKDKKIADHILALGVTAFDNDVGGIDGTTGRDIAGDYNGTLAVDDLFVAYADMVNQGFTPDTLLVNPLAWLIFARDPQMRHLAYWDGGAYFGTSQGKLPYAGEFETGTGGAQGAWNGSLGMGGESAIAGMYHPVYKSFPVPLKIVVSPSLPVTAASGSTPAKTTMVMCDSKELGVLFVDEEPTSDQWDDPSRDIYKVKIRERYAIGILNAGQAVRSFKNVNIAKSYDYDERITWDAATASLPSGGYTP